MSAVGNGFRILDAVVDGGGDGLSFAAIVEATGLPKATVHRLLKELVALAALTHDPASRRYRAGMRLARLGAHVLSDFDLRKTVHPHLAALHEETGHVATLGILERDTGVYVDKIEPRDFGIRLHSEIGKHFPLHCTAMGKMLLAGLDPATRERLLARHLDAYTDNTVTDRRALLAELNAIGRRGYAIDNEEITRGLICVAAPVIDHDGRTRGAMSCTFPRYLKDERGIDAEIDAVVRHSAAASGLATQASTRPDRGA